MALSLQLQLVALLLCLSLSFTLAGAKVFTVEELTDKLDHLHADDKPLVRYTVTDETFERQEDGCLDLPDMIAAMKDNETSLEAKTVAAQIVAVCVNERPEHRDVVSDEEGYHDAVVALLGNAPAAAAELIYISVFSHDGNHEGFNKAGAVDELIRIVMEHDDSQSLMWSLAALANLAASYCDGVCYYEWEHPEVFGNVQDEEEEDEEVDETAFNYSPPQLFNMEEITIDSMSVREYMIEKEGFLGRVVDLVCSSIALVKHDHPLPQDSAPDENHVSIVPWAAAGLVKNLAIDEHSHESLEDTVVCLCWLLISDDGFEYDKASTALYHLDREAACHFKDAKTGEWDPIQEDTEEYLEHLLCVDDRWYSAAESKQCGDLDPEEECSLADEYGLSATSACCRCGGGSTYEEPTFHHLLYDEPKHTGDHEEEEAATAAAAADPAAAAADAAAAAAV